MFDCYIKIEGYPGESTDSKHKDWIEVLSYSHGVRQSGEATSREGGMSAGRANFHDFTFVKMMEKSSPALAKACAEGKHISKAEVQCCQAAGDKHCFMKIVFSDLLLSAVTPTGNTKAQESRPLEEVSFRYTKIEYEYTPIDQAGKPQAATKSSWDLKTNTGA
jgi:type VI secretion system secreted protein Hcp